MKNFYKEPALKKYLSKTDNPNVHLHGINRLPFRMVVNAPSGSGKSNFVVNLIELFSKNDGTFSSIEIFCRCKDEPLYQFLHDKTKGGIKIYEDLSELKNINSYDKTENSLIVFDDLVLTKDQSMISEFFLRGRKQGISLIYLSQSYYQIPKMIRLNSNYLVILKLGQKRNLNMIMSELSLGVTKDQLIKIYNYATKDKFSVLMIDLDEPNVNNKFRKNFLDIIEDIE
jgi:hypothetical protein